MEANPFSCVLIYDDRSIPRVNTHRRGDEVHRGQEAGPENSPIYLRISHRPCQFPSFKYRTHRLAFIFTSSPLPGISFSHNQSLLPAQSKYYGQLVRRRVVLGMWEQNWEHFRVLH
jgi:hypothetical protein